jgi:hypothetical protein
VPFQNFQLAVGQEFEHPIPPKLLRAAILEVSSKSKYRFSNFQITLNLCSRQKIKLIEFHLKEFDAVNYRIKALNLFSSRNIETEFAEY